MTKEEFKVCFDQYFEPIRKYLYYRSGNEHLASDITQEVFLKLWEKQIKYEGTRTKNLLYKIASDLFISHFRKNKVAENYTQSLSFDFHQANAEEAIYYEELKTKYEKALALLPEKQRVVFLMNRIDELTYKEIAERLDLSVKAIEKRMTQAIASLKQQLIPNGKTSTTSA